MNRGILTAETRKKLLDAHQQAAHNSMQPKKRHRGGFRNWHYVLITIGLCAMAFSFGHSIAPERIVTKTVTMPETFYVPSKDCATRKMPDFKLKHSAMPAYNQFAAAIPASALGAK